MLLPVENYYYYEDADLHKSSSVLAMQLWDLEDGWALYMKNPEEIENEGSTEPWGFLIHMHRNRLRTYSNKTNHR